MANIDLLDVLYSKHLSPKDFNFELLNVPPLCMYLTNEDIYNLHEIATSIKLAPHIRKKYAMIDSIMRPRGFKRFSAGTNRVVYSYLEDTRFLAKIAVDRVGLQDNPLEYKNQQFLRPYVAKTFHVSQCGTVALSERVLPIKNIMEFREIASDVFDILVGKFLGEYVVQDVGTKYFMNWGIRMGFGPVLLDYPYVYVLDGKKLFCSKEDPDTKVICNGEIDYDAGFNSLICTKCGKTYLAVNLKNDSDDNKIIIQGGNKMKVKLMKGDEVMHSSDMVTTKCIERDLKPKRTYEDRFNFTVKLVNKPDSNNKKPFSKPTKGKQPQQNKKPNNTSTATESTETKVTTTVDKEATKTSNLDQTSAKNVITIQNDDSAVDNSTDNIETVQNHPMPQRDSKGRFLPKNPDAEKKDDPVDMDDYESEYDNYDRNDRNRRPRKEKTYNGEHVIRRTNPRDNNRGTIRKLPKV